jgi:hypothetical protein
MQTSLKNLVSKLIFAALASTTLGTAALDLEWQLRPYAGVDAGWRYMHYTTGYGDNLFKKDYPEGNLYLGFRFLDYLGIEAGYETTPTRTRTTRINGNELSLGVPALSPSELHLTKNRLKGWHTGIIGYLPVCALFSNPIELLGYVGQVRLKTFHEDIIAMKGNLPQNVLMSARTFVKRKSVLKLGIGAQYTFQTSGIRFMAGYENTKQFTGLSSQAAAQKRLSLKNGLLCSAGVFITMP